MATQTRPRSGLAAHGATAAFGVSRAATSYLRKRYAEKYQGAYKRAGLIFGIDLSLLAAAFLLVGLNIYFAFFVQPLTSGIMLTFASGPIEAASPVGLQATLSAHDGRPHGNVRLAWDLPAGTEILESEPAIGADGQMYIGDLGSGETRVARMVVRVFAPRGDVGFGFRVEETDGVFTGSQTRAIERSALTIKPLFPSGALLNGETPLAQVSNVSILPIRDVRTVEIRPSGQRVGEDAVGYTLDPDRDVIVRSAFSAGGRMEVRVGNTALDSADFPSVPPAAGTLTLFPSSGQTARLTVDARTSSTVEVYHYGLAHPHTKSFHVEAGRSEIEIRLDRDASDLDSRWYAALIEDGRATAFDAALVTAFTPGMEARYYASTGDQIGIGPLPPIVGQETRYWVAFKLGPTTNDLANVRLSARLAPGVSLTGRSALPSGGVLIQEGDRVAWSADFLPRSPEGAIAQFEIAITPDASMRGGTALLLIDGSASARVSQTDIELSGRMSDVDTSLPTDSQASGKGAIR